VPCGEISRGARELLVDVDDGQFGVKVLEELDSRLRARLVDPAQALRLGDGCSCLRIGQAAGGGRSRLVPDFRRQLRSGLVYDELDER
jgi:hypothetical protein